ncbi:MAG: tetratricopeptide repeat protein [Pyrinomonadaceae bacterium]
MPVLRLLLILVGALALVSAFYAGRWYFGNTIAEFTPKIEVGAMDSARTALSLAPDDPMSHWSAGQVEMKEFTAEQLAEAVNHFERAVSLSPNDYRLWMDLARAREQTGDPVGSEKAFRRAVELAPSYSYPRWFLGNLLLRQGRADEAFAELRLAGEADRRLRPQIFNLAWRIYGENVELAQRAVGDSAGARAELAVYLINQERVDDALRIWSSLSATQKKEQRETGEALVKALVAAKRYRAVLDASRDLAPQGASLAEAGQFFNGGFESDAAAVTSNVFGWQVNPSSEAQIAIDPRTAHQGSRSLRVVFNAPTTLNFNNISQLVVVEPATSYRFECFAIVRNLRTAGAPVIEIVDATDEKNVLGVSEPLSIESSDWQRVTVDFKTPEKMEAVTIRTDRAPCGPKMTVCPILGLVWYDDFNLQRTGGNADAGASSAGAGNARSAQQSSAR